MASRHAGAARDALMAALGPSPLELSEGRLSRLRAAFPLPREQRVIWADAEFDLRPSGVALTEAGVFIRTNAGILDALRRPDPEALSPEQARRWARYHSGRAVLIHYAWADFDAAWFAGDSEAENPALLVEPQCARRFIEACRAIADAPERAAGAVVSAELRPRGESGVRAGALAGAELESAQSAVFVGQRARANTTSGHGEMAEEAITMLDRLSGLDARVVGRDNARDGADRWVSGEYIQTKYYRSARGSMEACFDAETGLYRYMRDGAPMQLEVPSDQYAQVLEGFRKKIEQGRVPGVTDPAAAEEIVRRGRLSYRQAVNLTRPGTIESLLYDARTGAVSCACAMGLSFVATLFLRYRETRDWRASIRGGLGVGAQVFGLSFLQHILISQFARTPMADAAAGAIEALLDRAEAAPALMDALCALAGQSGVAQATALGRIARMLGGRLAGGAFSLAVFSIPDTYRLAARKISGAQFAKNMGVTLGSLAGGTGGAIAAGAAAAKISAAAGTAILPGVGTAVGFAGGLAGGMLGAKLADLLADILHEDDAERYARLFNAYLAEMMGEYLLDGAEMDALIDDLNAVEPERFRALYASLNRAERQEALIRNFLTPRFERVAAARARFRLPTDAQIAEALAAD